MQLPAKTAALVLIDLQKGIMGMNTGPHAAADVFARSMTLAQRVRKAGGLVVRVRVSFSAGGVDAPRQPVDQPSNFGSLPPDWDQLPDLDPADVVITKRQWGAFTGTELDLQLRRRGINRIVLGGISTNIGVESTARNAWELGYELVIVEDICAASSAEAHASSFKNIFPRLSRITTSESIELG